MRNQRLFETCTLVILMFTLTSCSLINITASDKPSLNYYTSNFVALMNNSKISKVVSYETDRSKDLLVEDSLYYIINGFTMNLREKNAIEKPKDLPENPDYKLYITFSNSEKYVFDIYPDDIVAIYPWDGEHSKDFISAKDLPNSYNLNRLCTYLYPRIQ